MRPAEFPRNIARRLVTVRGASVVVEATDAGVVGVAFLGARRAPACPRRSAAATNPRAEDIAARAAAELREYFAGRRRQFTVPVCLCRVSTAFARRVLEACARIPFGQVRTYAELAQSVAGTPAAARAVGRALAANPIPILIPCHRVVRSDGSLGGFGWGEDWKRYLLQLEGALPPPH